MFTVYDLIQFKELQRQFQSREMTKKPPPTPLLMYKIIILRTVPHTHTHKDTPKRMTHTYRYKETDYNYIIEVEKKNVLYIKNRKVKLVKFRNINYIYKTFITHQTRMNNK